MHDFIDSSIDENDLANAILPTMEKALLRSPEVSLAGQPFLRLLNHIA